MLWPWLCAKWFTRSLTHRFLQKTPCASNHRALIKKTWQWFQTIFTGTRATTCLQIKMQCEAIPTTVSNLYLLLFLFNKIFVYNYNVIYFKLLCQVLQRLLVSLCYFLQFNQNVCLTCGQLTAGSSFALHLVYVAWWYTSSPQHNLQCIVCSCTIQWVTVAFEFKQYKIAHILYLYCFRSRVWFWTHPLSPR